MDAGWATNVPCILTTVGTDGGFILAAKTKRLTVLNKKTFEVRGPAMPRRAICMRYWAK